MKRSAKRDWERWLAANGEAMPASVANDAPSVDWPTRFPRRRRSAKRDWERWLAANGEPVPASMPADAAAVDLPTRFPRRRRSAKRDWERSLTRFARSSRDEDVRGMRIGNARPQGCGTRGVCNGPCEGSSGCRCGEAGRDQHMDADPPLLGGQSLTEYLRMGVDPTAAERIWAKLQERYPGQSLAQALGRALTLTTNSCAGAANRLRTGEIDFRVPSIRQPFDLAGEAFNFMMSPYTAVDVRYGSYLDWRRVDGLIDSTRWNPPLTRPTFSGWASYATVAQPFVRHLMQLVYAFRNYIPTRWPPFIAEKNMCEGMPTRLGARFIEGTPLVGVENTSKCADVVTGRAFFWSVAKDGTYTFSFRDSGDRGHSAVNLCPALVEPYAECADFFLSWGNRAYWYALSGACPLDGALHLLKSARLCGMIALGAFMIPARTLVHEVAHRLYPVPSGSDPHCDLACCPQGLAGRFWFATAAYLGVPVVDVRRPVGYSPTQVLDTSFGRQPSLALDAYSSLCRTSPQQGYREHVEFTSVGYPGNRKGYRTFGLTIPSACDAPRAVP